MTTKTIAKVKRQAKADERAAVARESNPAQGERTGEGGLALCQAVSAGLIKYFDDQITVSAVAGWRPEMRAEVIDWLEQFDAEDPPEEPTSPPEWLVRTHQLRMALEPYESSVEEWQCLVRSGATKFEIVALIASLLEVQGADCVGTDWGPVCWSIDERRPSLWFGEEHPPRRKADLNWLGLVQAARELYGIAEPPLSVNDHPELRNGSGAGSPAAAESSDINRPAARVAGPVETLEIPPELIERFPGNPRDELEFDEAELRELGADLARRQVQACVVRAIPGGRYQLIAGERRWRAARLVDLPALRCEVVDVSDAEAVWMCGVENEKRAEWSAIARARWYRAVKEAEGLTVEQLAAKAGVSQGQVSSCLGLLELPDEWQRRVISREISGTAVRPLIPWAKKRPQVLEQVAIELCLPGSGAKHERQPDHKISVREMEEVVLDSLKKLTRCMNPDDFMQGAPLFSITPARRKLLDCEKLKVNNWQGAVSRAWNVAEWDRLQREAKKKPKAGSVGAVGRREEATSDWAVSRWVTGWLAELIAARIGDDASGQLLALRILAVMDAMDAVQFDDMNWKDTAGLTADSLLARMPEAAGRAMRERYWRDDVLAEIAQELGIDLAAAFRPDAELLECFSLEDLRTFAGVGKARKSLPKPELIDHLLVKWQPGWMPPLIRKSLGLPASVQKKAGKKQPAERKLAPAKVAALARKSRKQSAAGK